MEDILSQHSALASYRNNSLFTTLPHTADINILQNESREPTTEELQNVLGLQVHEYIHQLHNLSTIAGLQLLTNRLSSLRLFATGADENGHYIRAGKNYKHVEKSKLENFERDLNRILGNTGKISQEGFLKFLSFDRFEYSEETDDPTDPCNMLGIKINYELAGRKRNIKIENVGYHIITEGIAYEIERQVRNNITDNNGVQLEYSTPPFPYRFFRPIVEHLVGRSCSLEELVKVGTLALQNKVPSWGLKAASLALSHSAELFLIHAQDVMVEYEKTLEFYKKTVDHLTQSAFEGRAINQGLSILDGITKKAIAKRVQDPFYELEFVRENLSPEKFLRIIQDEAFPQRCIIQSKKNEESEESEEFNGSPIETEVYWMGSGVMDYTEEMAGSISTLQCALQYSQLHLTTQSRFENTSSLGYSTNNHSCPYLNACPLKEDKSDQDLCSISPWMHDVGLSDGEVCWYVSGVKSLRNIDPDKYDDEYI